MGSLSILGALERLFKLPLPYWDLTNSWTHILSSDPRMGQNSNSSPWEFYGSQNVCILAGQWVLTVVSVGETQVSIS